MSALRRWLTMTCLATSAAVIYLLPYSTEVYYKPLQEALGLDNKEIGWLMSTLGVVNMLGYLPGGWLADRFSPRVLLTFSLAASGAVGFYFATFPSYGMCIFVYAAWGLTSVMTFWSALIKATRDWGGRDEQGRAFGLLEGGRGVVRLALSSLGVAVFGWFADKVAGFATVVVLYSSLNVALALAVWLVLRQPAGDTTGDGTEERSGVSLREVLEVLRLPAIWLITLVIFSAYGLYLASFYFTPFATDVFGLGVVAAGALATGKMALRPIGAVAAGFAGDRVGASRMIAASFVVASASFAAFALFPSYSDPGSTGPSLWILLLFVGNVLLATFCLYALRGLYYALLEEGAVPAALTGTATGVVSVLGYTPDIFLPPVAGALLDRYPGGEGYRYLYIMVSVLALAGVVAALVFMRRSGGRTQATKAPALPRLSGSG